MSTGAKPSRDRANDGTLAGMVREVFKKRLQGIERMLPAQVVSYDRATNIATVKPLIQLLTTEGEAISRAQIASIPVLAVGGGDFVISFPVAAGDLGWIESSDRDISLFLQSLAESPPNSLRMHSFSDGRFIPDKMRSFTIDGTEEGAAVFQNLAGTSRVSLRPDGTIFMKAGSAEVTIDPAGKFSFDNTAIPDEILQILVDFMTVTAAAVQNTGSVMSPATKALMNAVKARLEAMQP